MRTGSGWRSLAVALLLAGAHSIPADTVDFDSLPTATILTNQLVSSCVRFSRSTMSGLIPGTVVDMNAHTLGIYDFGNSMPRALFYGAVGDQLNIEFVTPDGDVAVTDSVSLRVGDGDESTERFRVSFKALNGDILNQQEYTTTNGAIDGGVTVAFATTGIHRIEIRGIGGTGGAIDDLTFHPVSGGPRIQSLLCGDNVIQLCVTNGIPGTTGVVERAFAVSTTTGWRAVTRVVGGTSTNWSGAVGSDWNAVFFRVRFE